MVSRQLKVRVETVAPGTRLVRTKERLLMRLQRVHVTSHMRSQVGEIVANALTDSVSGSVTPAVTLLLSAGAPEKLTRPVGWKFIDER